MFPGPRTTLSEFAWAMGLLRGAHMLRPAWLRRMVFDAEVLANDQRVALWMEGTRRTGRNRPNSSGEEGHHGGMPESEWVAFSCALLDEILAAEEMPQDEEALTRVMAAAHKRSSHRPVGAVTSAGVSDDLYQRFLVETIRSGAKPGALYEILEEGSAAQCETLALRSGVAAAWRPGKQGQSVVVLARDDDTLQRLQRAMEEAQSEASTRERADARMEVGRMLGYPACCSARYCDEISKSPELTNAWLEMKRRVECPHEVAASMNPAVDLLPVKAVPCSLTCGTARLCGDVIDEVAVRTLPQAAWRRLREAAPRPWLMSLETDGAGAELVIDDIPDGRFPYAVGLVASRVEERSEPVISLLKKGDGLDIGPHWIRVYKGDRMLADLTGRSYVWWARRPVQTEFLMALFEARRFWMGLLSRDGAVPSPLGGERKEQPAFVAPLRALLSNVNESVRHLGVSLSAYRYVDGVGGLEFLVSGESPDHCVVLRCKPSSGGKSYLLVGQWEITHPREHPIDTQEKRNLVALFRDALTKAISGTTGESATHPNPPWRPPR